MTTMEKKTSKTNFTGNSFGSKMDRIKPEKVPRQRVQKLWRSVRWASEFPEESISIDPGEITPTFALRKVALLFETKKYSDCAALIRRLNCVMLSGILQEVPIDVLHDTLPQSLTVLEALYMKLYETSESPTEFPKEQLQVDQFLLKLVAMFTKQAGLNNKHEKNTNSVYPSCRNILRVILWIEPNVRRMVRTKKKALDKCVRHLGRHGLVESSEGTLMNLHDAFKIEFENVIGQYRNALQKLEELNLSHKHPTASSVTFGPAPSSASHHRMMQITRDDVQDRIIKNRTLHNLCDPPIMNQYLRKFVHILEKRIEYDKIVLFHDTELRKLGRGQSGDPQYLAASLRDFSEGYGTVLQLLWEVTEEDVLTEEDEEEDEIFSSDEETISPLMHKERLRSLSGLNGILQHKNTGGGSTSRRHRQFKGRSFTEGTRPSIVPINQTFRHGSVNGLNRNSFPNGTLSTRNGGKIVVLQGEAQVHSKEMEVLQAQLDKAQEMVRFLQDREQHYLQQISQLQVNMSKPSAHGADKVTELVRQYGQLFVEDRDQGMEALHALPDLKEVHSLKGKILFSVVVKKNLSDKQFGSQLSFRSVQQSVQEIRGKLRHILNLPAISGVQDDPAAMEMEKHIEEYLSKSAQKFDISNCVQEVISQILATLYDYPCLKSCEGLKSFICACVNVAWGLSVQQPPYIIVYDSRVFQPEIHTRTDSSSPQNVMIQNFLWPALLHGDKGLCVHKGIVET